MKPNFNKGDTVYILTEWEGFFGDFFVVNEIMTVADGTTYYYQDNIDWNWYIEKGSANGWWEECCLSLEDPNE